jgi:hypothetical protein
MREFILLLSALCWLAPTAFAEDQARSTPKPADKKEIPTLRIFPEDVVQNSIHEWRAGTNQVVVYWTYTEAGARKMLAFRETHTGKFCTAAGTFVTPPAAEYREDPGLYARWKEGWLKTRTDKFFGVSEGDAKAIVAGLKKK